MNPEERQMPTPLSLQDVRVARPCPARWEEMAGDDRVRFCSACRKDVYNLSAMTEAAALELLRSRGEVCGLLYRRRDGTVLTADCPVGRTAFVRRATRRLLAATAGVLVALGGRFLTPAFESALVKAEERPSMTPVAADPPLNPTAPTSEEIERLELLGALGYLE